MSTTKHEDEFVDQFLAPTKAEEPPLPEPEERPQAQHTSVNQGSDEMHDQIVDALKQVYDPEIPVNIYDLGLIYRIDIDEDSNVEVDMTLTAPGCPVAQTFPLTVEAAVKSVPGVSEASVEVVWDPPWTQERMTEAARLQLGLL
jgi:FeS assembly SUF system protein